ncbi:uncharacterized protein MONBRDRAFT_38147 [Monosiga brevicollis MX1]|uniref:receptor protein-tyrosine kinase n=1 Tax=Monosiga brevicollis TaxID=81824 RepID=A9V5Y7_MONBE|nr:uncharacterized protein MONBRDRAFT_38147 [Monosiga brevicollis MX1]EDQ87130.1 predicted protein [Monosiga brevicollis MX1]|eukprot:XP_001748073.1 hypothetical protein [Monosiga brevicollis MX1]
MIRSVRARVVATSLWLLAAMAHAAPIDTTASTTPNKANPISMVDPVLQIDTVVVSTLPEYADWPLLHKQLDQTMDQLLETGVVSLRDSTGKVVVLDSIDGAIEGTTVDNLLTAGYSLVIKPEQEPSLTSSMHAFTVSNDISQQIQAHLGVVMSEHFYISPPGQRALSPHTDGGDVFVHQWAGSKLWTLCVPTAPDCLDCTFADLALRAELAKSAFQGLSSFPCGQALWIKRARSRCLISKTLEYISWRWTVNHTFTLAWLSPPEGCTSYTDEQLAGMECRTLDLQENELLYVPRGVVHFARANTTGLSAHATYQVVPPSSTWIDMVVDECSLTATMRACNELKNQLLQADLGFRWLNFRFKDVHVAPVLPNKLITSEYSLHSTRLAELVVRPASNDESVTRTCGKGTFHNTVRCLSCGSGTYQDSASHLSTSCKTKSRCPAGTYDANGGSSSSNTNCLACPAGSYQDATNHLETSCKTKTNTCPVGHYASNGGSTTSDRICAVCPDACDLSHGAYQDQTGQTSCDGCGVDVTPPELTLAPNAIVRFEALTNTFVYPTVTATDTSGERIVVTHTNNVQPDEVGTYDVTYSGEDSAKNKGVLVVQVIIFAARKPVIVLLGPVVMTLEVHTRFNDPMGYVIDEGEPNNLNNTLASNTSALDIDTLGTYYVVYSMHTPDSQGLTASPVRRTVHVVDTTPPGVNVTVEAGSTWSEPGFSIRDNYDTMAIGDVTVEPVALNLKVPNGTVLTVDYMATDRSGNAVSITRYVLVLDRLAPTITLLNATRLTAEAGDLYFEFDAVAEDQLDDDVDLSITYPDGVTVGGELQPPSLPFDYSIVYTARDDVGNTAHATRNLTVVDTKAPSLEAITSEVHLEAGAAYSINASWYSVHDNYKATPTISTNVSALPRTHVMTPYRANVQITATDSQGNRNATSLRVLLVDTTAPMLTLITSNVTSGTDFHISDLVTAYDSNDGVLDSVVDMNTHGTNVLDLPSTPTCPVDRIRSAASNAYQQARAERIRSTNTQVVGDAPAGSTYTVDFIVTDAAGNSDSLRGVVLTLRDDTAPVIATSGTPTGQIEYTRAANQLELPLTASDNLDGDISSWVCLSVARYAPRTAEGTPNVLRTGLLEPVSHNFNDFAEMGRPWGASGGRPLLLLDEPVGTLYVVNASVMDGAGNTATRTFRYLIVDTTPPVLTLTYPGSYHVPYDTTFIDPGFTVFDESDDLSEHVLVLNADRVNPRFPGTYLVQYRTNDRYGNPAEAARTVIVDNFILPADDDIVTITYAASIILAPAARAFEEQLRGALGYPYIFVVGRHAGADTTKDRFNTLPGSASSSSSRRRSLQAATNTSFELCMRSTTTLAWVPAEALAGMIRAWNNSDVTVAVDTNDDVDTVDSETRQGTSASNSLTTIVIGGAAGGVILLLLILVFILHRRKQNRVTVPATSEDLYAFFDVRDADIWEVERRFVRLGEKLGNGAFGQVFRAWFCNRHSGEERSCAAKALKPGAPFRARQDFLSEMTVMKEIGAHPNIIGIFGHCLRDEPHILLVELAELGNLRDYLRKCRTSQSKPQLLGSRQLADFCLQIASGMSFLERKNVIHRDLAARNVLLSQSLACKICDFGLARSIENEDYETTATKLPVKWMAPESLGYRIYTSKSDVWSFGVTMWEIFSLGGTPYVKHRNVDILSLLADGYRLPKPRQAPGQADAIARMCWMHEADNRPTFLELVDLLTAFIRKKNFSLAEPEVDSDGLYEAIGDPTEDSEGSGIRAIMSGTEGMGAGIYESQINGDEIYDNEFDGHMMTEGPSFENMAFSTDSAQASIGFGFFPAASVGERCQPSVFDRNANEEEALQHSETTIYDLAIDDLEI